MVALLVGHLAAPSAEAATTVACVGDSITQNSGWPMRLGTLLGAGYTSTNYGVSGTTLLKQGDSPYWNTGAFAQSHQSNPAIVVIMLGTNDSKPQNWNAHKGEFVADYEALIDSYTALPSHPRIFLNLCPPAGINGFAISGTVIENEMLPLIRQVAAAKGARIIDVFSAFGGHNFDPALYGTPGDQVHPNGAGAQRIADTVYAALKAAADLDGGVPDASNDTGARDVAVADTSGDASPGDTAAGDTGGGADAGTEAAVADAAADTSPVEAGPSTDVAADRTTADTGGTPVTPNKDDGGCGCRTAGPPENASGSWALALLGLIVAAHRRRRVCP
jgi:MYXO-CTERM domain-containing protein